LRSEASVRVRSATSQVGAEQLEAEDGLEPDDVDQQREDRRRAQREEEPAPRLEGRMLVGHQ
jgi:hypothetical protein